MRIRETEIPEAGRPVTVLRTWQVMGGFFSGAEVSEGRREDIVLETVSLNLGGFVACVKRREGLGSWEQE